MLRARPDHLGAAPNGASPPSRTLPRHGSVEDPEEEVTAGRISRRRGRARPIQGRVAEKAPEAEILLRPGRSGRRARQAMRWITPPPPGGHLHHSLRSRAARSSSRNSTRRPRVPSRSTPWEARGARAAAGIAGGQIQRRSTGSAGGWLGRPKELHGPRSGSTARAPSDARIAGGLSFGMRVIAVRRNPSRHRVGADLLAASGSPPRSRSMA